ncbi:MAG TPA: glycosyltransferase 87 family protein [Gemmatimonadota bacterium]|nr:glycosyltransferase 87 family protein [Gemmatimonadota bacterium]
MRRIGAVVGLGVIPAIALVTMLAIGLGDASISADFHHEIYPQAKEMLEGRNPYPPPDFDPTATYNFIWPPLVAYVLSPLTLLPAGAADVVMVLIGLACFVLALWLVGVRDWRVFGVLALWPQVAGEMRVSHLTAPLCLLVALAWRTRDARVAPGIPVGIAAAAKFFVWPVGVWLLSRGRPAAALIAGGIAAASLLLVLPFTSLDDYGRALLQLGRGFDQDSYTLFGLLVQSGASETVGRIAVLAAGVILLAATWRYRSLTLAIAAALTLSPIVWLDYFALAAVPLAIARPRLSLVWFLPLATWGLRGAGLGIGDPSEIARLLVVFGIVLAVAFHGEPDRRRTKATVAA